MAKARTAGPVRRVSNVGFWLSGPELVQSPLAAGCCQTVSTKAAVDQAEDNVPHDQTSLLGRQPLIAPVGFRRSSPRRQNGFVGAAKCFAPAGRMKQLHGRATAGDRVGAG
jgi:hypothetical protein